MTDPDERIINRALMYLEDDDEAIAEHRENARAALHRLFRDRRSLEKENELLRNQRDSAEKRYREAEKELFVYKLGEDHR